MKINVMDKIWDRKSFEVGSHWPLLRGWKHRMTTQNRQMSNAKKTFTYLLFIMEALFRREAIKYAHRNTSLYQIKVLDIDSIAIMT